MFRHFLKPACRCLAAFALLTGLSSITAARAAASSETVSAPSGVTLQPLVGDTRIDALSKSSLKSLFTLSTSGDYRLDSLNSGYKQPRSTVTYSFYSDSVFHGGYYGAETGVHEVSAGVKANVRKIMAWYSKMMNLNLVEVTETPSTIGAVRIMDSTIDPSYAYTYLPTADKMFSVSGDVHLDSSYDRTGDTNGFQNPAGSHGYLALAHEIGHALGLKHPFEDGTTLPSGEDNYANTIMTYTFLGAEPATPMAYDLLTLHYIYGPRSNGGGAPYAFLKPDQYRFGTQLCFDIADSCKQLIWDDTPTMTLDFSGLPSSSSGYRLDLRPGGWLSTGGAFHSNYFTSGVALAFHTHPTETLSSPSNDTIYANSEDDVFAGYAPGRSTGHDVIVGADAADTVDLSEFADSAIDRAQSGNDLVMSFAPSNQITIQGYYADAAPQILTQTPSAPTSLILDASNTNPRYGDSVTLSGTLASEGTPLASRHVRIEAFEGGSWTTTGAATTDADGRFETPFSAMEDTTLRAAFDAEDFSYEATTSPPVTLTVRPRPTTLTLRFDGEDASGARKLAGSLLGEGGMPVADRTVTVETVTSTTAEPVTTAVTAPDGSFAATVPVDGSALRASFEGDAQFEGAHSAQIQESALRPTTLDVSVDTTLPAWKTAVHVTGTVASGSQAADGILVLERLAATGWTEIARTPVHGSATLSFTPARAETIRVRFVPSADFMDASGVGIRVQPYARMTAVAAKRVGKLLYDYTGTIEPAHAKGSHEIVVRRWLKTSSGWKSYGTVTATVVSSSSTTSTFRVARSRLPKAGSWKLRAYHAADIVAATWSPSGFINAR